MFRPPFLLVAVLALIATPAFAQHSDIEFDYQNGQITFHEAQPSFLDASWLYEGEFPVGGLSPNFTTNPGFASEIGEGLGVNPNDDIFINFLLSPSLGGALIYHDGTGFATTNASIQVEDNANPMNVITATAGGFSGGSTAFLQTADMDGDIHSHLDFTLSMGAAQGAYALLMDLETSATGIANSDPFWVIFNHGLDEAIFENTVVPAFQGSAIPEPGSAVVLGLATIALGMRRRTRS